MGSLLVRDRSWYTLEFTCLGIARQLGSNSRREREREREGNLSERLQSHAVSVTQDSWTLGFHTEVMAGGGAWERQWIRFLKEEARQQRAREPLHDRATCKYAKDRTHARKVQALHTQAKEGTV